MRTPIFLIALTVAAVAPISATAQTQGGDAALETLLAGRLEGAPVTCVNQRMLSASEVIDGTAIVYRTKGSRIYVNRPRSGADTLKSGNILMTRTIGSQLCAAETVDLVDRFSRFPQGFVILGDFVPYDRAITPK